MSGFETSPDAVQLAGGDVRQEVQALGAQVAVLPESVERLQAALPVSDVPEVRGVCFNVLHSGIDALNRLVNGLDATGQGIVGLSSHRDTDGILASEMAGSA